MANQQYISPSSHYFDRGIIHFKKKDGQLISAATIKTGYLLAINPKLIENAEDIYEKISIITAIDKELFLKSVSKKDDPYEEIKHRLNEDEAKRIQKLGINGVGIHSETWRYYPAQNLASSVLGFVGYNGDKLEGRYGLEKYYESILKRGGGGNLKINSFAETIIDIKNLVGNNSQEGDIILTIDPEVQTFLENNLNELLKKYDAQLAGGIIIEPKTGKILAMAAKPDFDPNNYAEIKNLSFFLNPNVQNTFEMGSIMKALTLAAGLDLNKITPQSTYRDEGFVILNNKRIENYDSKGRGLVDMQTVLNKSLNTGAVFVMQQIGKENFYNYILNYGLGEKTGIDLPDEVSGLISNLKSDREVEYATASFGQGIAVTPIEMACALSALANGGLLMKPYIIDEIRSEDGVSRKKIEPIEKRRVLKQETSEEISRMLVKVTDEALVNGAYKMDHYTIAAKTGTAQMHKEDQKGYYENEYIHSFFGYAPAFDARFLILLYLVKPQGVAYASHSLTEPFINILKFLLNYYQVPPDR
ncbi:MAG: penicillin-binding protein 2 [Patescibacteria group bacterium]